MHRLVGLAAEIFNDTRYDRPNYTEDFSSGDFLHYY